VDDPGRERAGLSRLTRFLDANRFPSRIKSGAGLRLKTLWRLIFGA
jgi:hypothetical protein